MNDFAQRYGAWAVVLGASEGLGAAWAHAAARRGLSVLAIARRTERLEKTAQELRAHGVEVRTAALDLARPDLSQALAEVTAALDVGLVVYNACHSVIGEFTAVSLQDKLRTVDVNVRGPLITCDLFGPRMVARGRGGIVLMSSLSALQGTAMVGTYAATKAFDLVLGETLWEELGHHGVDVLVCAAGATNTPNFLEQTPMAARKVAMPLDPEAVVERAIAALGAGPTVVPGGVNRGVAEVIRRIPRRWAVRFMSRNTRKMYAEDL